MVRDLPDGIPVYQNKSQSMMVCKVHCGGSLGSNELRKGDKLATYEHGGLPQVYGLFLPLVMGRTVYCYTTIHKTQDKANIELKNINKIRANTAPKKQQWEGR